MNYAAQTPIALSMTHTKMYARPASSVPIDVHSTEVLVPITVFVHHLKNAPKDRTVNDNDREPDPV